MNTTTKTLSALAGLALLAGSADASLIHRYSFTTDVTDSVGTADGTLVNGAAVSGGAVQLDGIDDYVNLPGSTINITQYTSGTFEAWWTHTSDNVWQRIFDFGDDAANASYVMYSPVGNPFGQSRQITSIRQGTNAEQQVLVDPRLATGSYHVAIVVDDAADELRYYLNGVLQGTNNAMTYNLNDVSNANAYLGKAMFPDPYLAGSIDEFRIYNTPLSDAEVLASFTAGPDAIPEPGSLALLGLGGLCVLRRRRG